MPVEPRVKAILKSAELSFELGIINATRYGPLIHANVPDYAEILLKVFLEENGQPVPNNFPDLVKATDGFIGQSNPADQPTFQQLSSYFTEIRRSFRNPLHHTDRVQGYVIERSEALLCLLRFNALLILLFPTIVPTSFDELNYPCYVQFIKLEYDQGFGRNNRLYQAVMSAIRRIEQENAYRCPVDFDSSRLIAVRQIYHYDPDTFTRIVLNYRPHIRNLIAVELYRSPNPLSSNQLLPRLRNLPNNNDLNAEEVERCLAFMEGERIDGYGVVTSVRGRTSSGNSIIRYSFQV